MWLRLPKGGTKSLTLLLDGEPRIDQSLAQTIKMQILKIRLLALAVLLIGSGSALAHGTDMFENKAEALRRAKELRCTLTFAMGNHWMPCSSFDIYTRAVSKHYQ